MRQIPMVPDPVTAGPALQPPASDILLSVRDLTTHFQTREGLVKAVDGLSFDVPAGRVVGIVGETGCGKSVAARSILGIVERPGKIVSGQILLRQGGQWRDLVPLDPYGEEMRRVRGGEIGLVFQEPMTSFSPVHTIGNQLLEAVRLHNDLAGDAIRERGIELLTMVGVPRPAGYLDAYSWQMSGGLRQRAMIAMALAGRPRLLIADEPTTALDVITQAQILRTIRDLQENAGLSLLMITHDLGVIAQMADEVVVMYLGRAVERGPVDQIFHEPRHPYTRALLRSVPSAQPTARARLTAISGSVPHPLQRPHGCAFHPRCESKVADVCEDEQPSLHSLGSRHEFECHLANHAAGAVQPGPRTTLLTVVEPAAAAPREPAPEHPLLEVVGLHKSFPIQGRKLGRVRGRIQAVQDVSFSLVEGETLALVGESGSGKTSVARCVMRDHTPDGGQILFRPGDCAEVDLAKLSKRQLRPVRRDLQMVFQDPYSSLNPRMTVFDLISEPLVVNGIGNRRSRADRVSELLDLVGLRQEYVQRFPHAFSGGQRQRIGIARALALNPRLVVADEPVSALDVSVQAQTLNLLLDLQTRLGLTYLFVSHDLSVVRHISDRIAVMYAGQIVEMGERGRVLNSPRHPYTSALLGAALKPDPRQRAVLTPPRGNVADLADLPAGCYFHARCPFAVDRCAVERPALETSGDGHAVRCHRAAELNLAGMDAVAPAAIPKSGLAELPDRKAHDRWDGWRSGVQPGRQQRREPAVRRHWLAPHPRRPAGGSPRRAAGRRGRAD
jgi:oligopeptide/dipeptide ABC transporter ATP-binding protein